jgi:hypothetical protein
MSKFMRCAILIASIGLLSIAGAAKAQTATQTGVHPTKAPAPARYVASKEETLEGTVSSVVTKPTAGMLIGAHVILATPKGNVDGHLGTYAMKFTNPVSLTPGERVQMTGVMTTSGGNRVFLVRTVQAGSHVYKIRNDHGFLLKGEPKASQGGKL